MSGARVYQGFRAYNAHLHTIQAFYDKYMRIAHKDHSEGCTCGREENCAKYAVKPQCLHVCVCVANINRRPCLSSSLTTTTLTAIKQNINIIVINVTRRPVFLTRSFHIGFIYIAADRTRIMGHPVAIQSCVVHSTILTYMELKCAFKSGRQNRPDHRILSFDPYPGNYRVFILYCFLSFKFCIFS